MNRQEFQSLALERLDDAGALLHTGRYSCAYYIAGYVVECALKACIAGQTKQDDFPPRDAAKYYTHDLTKLLDSAGLRDEFRVGSDSGSQFQSKLGSREGLERRGQVSESSPAGGATAGRDNRSSPWSIAMVKKTLVEGLIKDGATLLSELDRQSFPVESMFWVELPDQGYWRLVIASPLVSGQGSAAAYRRLQEVLLGIELAGLTLEDITLLEPASQQFRSLRSVAESSSRLAVGVAWVVFEEAIVYRWTGTSLTGELSCDLSSEQLTRVWEAERKRSNLSVLLISVDARRVTLRFHPRHGTLSEIENIKQPFQIALHRPEAFPQCQVNWLA